jgi:chromatin remodeling complex protein RSC6
MTPEQTAAIHAVAAAINRLADAVAALKTRSEPEGRPPSEAPSKKRSNAMVMLSPELASFTGLSSDQPVTRQDAAAVVMKYVKDNDLQDPADRRKIHPDAALAALLGSDEVLNVLNLKSSLKSHFTAAPS